MEASSLALLIDLARNDRDSAQARQAQFAQRAARCRQALQRLRDYAEEYQARAMVQRQRGMDAATESNQRSFDERMVQALAAQQQELLAAEQAVREAAAVVAHHERRLKSLLTLVARQAARELVLANKREQKMNDEYARRAYAQQQSDTAEPDWT